MPRICFPRLISRSLAGVLSLALVLTACGDSEDADQSSPPPVSTISTPEAATPETTTPATTTAAVATSAPTTAPTTTPATEPAVETRTVEHELGTSEVPVDPQRIVVVDRRGTLAFMLELGVQPVGALDATWLFGQPFHPLIAADAEAAGVQPIEDTDGPNLEQVALLDPDLIIGNVRDMGETADELAQIAPTIGLSWNFADPLANAVTIGEALGLGEQAQTLVAEFDEALESASAATADPGTVSIIGLFANDDLRIYREHNLYGALTTQLGGQVVPSEAELAYDPEDNEVNAVSMEELGLASGDRLIAFVNVAPEADAAYRELESQPLVQALPGFQNGQVLEADPQLAFGAAGVTGIRAMLDQLVEFYAS